MFMKRKVNSPKKSKTQSLNNNQTVEATKADAFTGFETPPTTILEAVKRVVMLAEDSGMQAELLKVVEIELDYIASRFEITREQALVFAAVASYGTNNVDLNDLSRFFDIDRVSCINMVPMLDALVRYGLLKSQRGFSQIQYIVPTRIVRLLSSNGEFKRPKLTGLKTDELLKRVRKLFHSYRDRDFPKQLFIDEVNLLFDSNPKCPVVKAISKVTGSTTSRFVLLLLCAAILSPDGSMVSADLFEAIVEDEIEAISLTESLSSGEHPLFEQGYLTHPCEEGLEDTSAVSLTDAAVHEFLPDVKLPKSSRVDMSAVVKAADIKPKTLFYNSDVQEAVDELTNFFSQERYNEIVTRLRDRNLRCAFTCLFYGGPGTGKTETVYQLARLTGRDVFVVDLSTVKDKWVGESEKNVKAIFDNYRRLAKQSSVAPILLLNEADGLLTRRLTNPERAVDQMINTMQNIILQEMENLDGILIATTNLTDNLDDAFERRFLYKVRFDRPDVRARGRIWQAMLPELPDGEADKLAAAFDFSGGEIENVTRKYGVSVILHGEDSEHRLDTLIDICSNEKIAHRRAVGF